MKNEDKIVRDVDAIFARVRRIELILALMAGAMAMGGSSIGLKVFGVL